MGLSWLSVNFTEVKSRYTSEASGGAIQDAICKSLVRMNVPSHWSQADTPYWRGHFVKKLAGLLRASSGVFLFQVLVTLLGVGCLRCKLSRLPTRTTCGGLGHKLYPSKKW